MGGGDSVHSLVSKGLSELIWFSWNKRVEERSERVLENNGKIFSAFWTLEILRQEGKAMEAKVNHSDSDTTEL